VMRDRWRTVVTICFIAALFVPVVRDGDGVPFSSYSMYASPRSPEIAFIVAIGQDVDGDDVVLSPRTIAATADPLIVESYLRREVEGGRVATLCATIARRVVDTRVGAIQIRSDRLHVVDRVLGQSPPIKSELLASCPVP